MNRNGIALAFASALSLFAHDARAQRTCSDDGLGRGSRFVGRMDYGPRWYVRPLPGGTSSFDFSFVGGYWFVLAGRCSDWHFRLQPELALDLSIIGNLPVEVRGRAGLAVGAGSMLVQPSYFASAAYGTALGASSFGFVHGARLEMLFGAAGVELQHGYFPRASGDVHTVALHGLIDVYATIALFSGLARWAR